VPSAPDVSVVVPSHDRPLRLRWLLNALEEQTFPAERWELVVVHDSRGEETAELLATHPLRERVEMRTRQLEPGTGTPARQRNVGWRMARAPLIAFTDDDCRPEPGWLEALVRAAASGEAGAIVQGAARPDPNEIELLAAPHARTLNVDPPDDFGQTCNIAYPRELLERLGGFDEIFALAAGEDTDLLWRAREAGAPHVAAPESVVYHAVEAFTALGLARRSGKWLDLPAVARRHPELRARFPFGGRFWRDRHMWLLASIAGGLVTRRATVAALLAVPYLRWALSADAEARPRGRARAAAEVPGRVLVDLSEIRVLVRGSIRHRTVFL
jgi:glycosyltransferase involved in cell wall biosynthesis